MKLRILSDAEDDLIEAFHFYEGQQATFGHDFLDHLDQEVLHLPSVCGIHSKQFGYHRALVRTRFPFAIYYTYDTDSLYIHAVFDCRKDPKEIADRMGN